MHLTVRRGGPYYRVVAPEWVDPANTAYSKQRGGRWNPAGEFGALYLNATVEVAAANARAQHSGRAVKLFDLLPEARPELVTFEVPTIDALDACTAGGIAALGFADSLSLTKYLGHFVRPSHERRTQLDCWAFRRGLTPKSLQPPS